MSKRPLGHLVGRKFCTTDVAFFTQPNPERNARSSLRGLALLRNRYPIQPALSKTISVGYERSCSLLGNHREKAYCYPRALPDQSLGRREVSPVVAVFKESRVPSRDSRGWWVRHVVLVRTRPDGKIET